MAPWEVLYNLPLWSILIGMAVLFPLTAFLGQFVGQKFLRSNVSFETSNFVPTTILGLLALLLGFTFSMSVSRFDTRRQLVLSEANAIGTAYLRIDTVPEPYKKKLKDLFKAYVPLRLEYHETMGTQEQISNLETKTKELQNLMWKEVVQIVKDSPTPISGLFEAAINDVIDISAERMFSIDNRVPEVVYFIIFFVTLTGIFSLGFFEGLAGKNSVFGILTLSILFAVVIVLIQDLDRPRRGLIRVGQRPMVLVMQDISEDSGN